jgi:hypothetical protein
LVGVLGGDDSVAHLAELIRQRSVLGVTGRLQAQTGGSCGVGWIPTGTPNQPKRASRASVQAKRTTKTKRGKQHGGR